MKRLAPTLLLPACTGAATAAGPMEHLGGAFAAAVQLHAITPLHGSTASSSKVSSCDTGGLAAALRATAGSEPLVASPGSPAGLSTPPLDSYSTAGPLDADAIASTTANSACTVRADAGDPTALGATSVFSADQGAGQPHARGHASKLRGAEISTIAPTYTGISGRTAAAYPSPGSWSSTFTVLPTTIAPCPYGNPAGRPTLTQPAWTGLPGAFAVRNRFSRPRGACQSFSPAACISNSTCSGAVAVPTMAVTATPGQPLAAAAAVVGRAALAPASAPHRTTSGLGAAVQAAGPVRRRILNSDPGAGAGADAAAANTAREGAGAEGSSRGEPGGGTTKGRRSRSLAVSAPRRAAAKGSQTATAVQSACSTASSSNCNSSSSSGASAMASRNAAGTEKVAGPEAEAEADGRMDVEIEVHDPEGIHVGSLGVAGGTATWHQRHVAEVAAAAAAGHSAGLGPPRREDFELQLLLENSCRHIALREARQQVSELRAEGRLEEAPSARRLLDAWVPQLAGRVAAAMEKYLLLEHQRTIRSDKRHSDSPAPPLAAATTPASPSQPGTAPNRPPAELRAAAVDHGPMPSSSSSHSLSPSANVTIAPGHGDLETPDSLPCEPPHTPAATSSFSAPPHVASPADVLLAASRIRSTSEERAALLARVMNLRVLSRFAPHVLCVPPQLVARATVAAVLNGLLLRDVAESSPTPVAGKLDLPPGTGLSMHIAENLGRRVMEMVSYMQVSEAVLAKTKELREAEAALSRMKKELGEDRGQQRQGQQRGDTEGQRGDSAQHASGGTLLGPYDTEVAAAAARVAAARAALQQLQKAASLLQPESMVKQGLKPQGPRRTAPLPLADLLPARSSKAAPAAGPTTSTAASTEPTTPRDSDDAADDDLVSSLLLDLSNAAAAAGGKGEGAPGRARALRVGGKLIRKTVDRPLMRRVVERADLAGRVQDWDISTRVQIGSCLLALALATLEVPAAGPGAPPEPAFSHSTSAAVTHVGGRYQTPGLVVAHPHVLEVLEGDEELRRLLRPRFLPMVVEPRPWSGVRRGGFLTQTSPVVKTRYSPLILQRLREAHDRGTLVPLYGGLTALGSVPWRINTRVLDVMSTIAEGGGGVLGLPPSAASSMPPRPTTVLNTMFKELLGHEAPGQCGTPHLRLQREGLSGGQLLVGAGPLAEAEEEAYQRQLHLVRLANRTAGGQRCILKHRLDLARQYSGRYDLATLYGANAMDGSQHGSSVDSGSGQPVVFFQPHNVDFRGRAYTLHPHLTHLADDPARGLLQFGVGRPLGNRGFRWLLVQVANLWGRGVDKLPLDERASWAQQQLPAIRASAARPLEPEGGAGSWWRQGEKPWQLLATCFEIDEALASGSPEAYVSHQPVLQDGTCNGLQHYAALARDEVCGAAVNLLPAAKPGDVYTAVAEAVARRVALDAAAGRSEAAKVDGLVDRKLVKQTVMTYVYGVTIIGAREQVESRLEERDWGSPRERRKVATYLAGLTFKSMGDVFGPAVAVRSWLADCAKAIATTGLPVMWTAPLGYPVEQPYRKVPFSIVETPLQNFRLRDMSAEAEAPVDKRRQRSAFPPNYIHSLDGSHMLATAARVSEAGACFAAVHDSFWTHAATVDLMGRALRDTFVEMHSRPLLAVLAAEVAANPVYKAARVKLPPLPSTGRLDLTAVRDAPYFFS